MNYKKLLIILFAIIFFLTALTFYLNRVIFPQLIKKIAVERIEDALKRKVEIGTIHFNWFRGFIIDKIKIYEKGSHDTIFAQADQVSFGIIFFPGIKHYRITIPFINVRSPSVHLIRTGDDTWNVSDLYTAPTVIPPSNPAKPTTPSAVEIAWGGITISDGKFLVDDISNGRKWNEFFDNINLKLSLSYKGISYDFNADIPGKKGFVGATVFYQPLTKNTQAQIRLKNIDTASYLSLVNIPDVHLESGIIKEINLNINYTQNSTSAKGDVVMQHLDITNNDQSFKGDIDIHNLDAKYQNGDISARGQIALSNVQTKVPGLSTGGSVQARVSEFEYTSEGVNFAGSLHAQNIFLNLDDRQVRVADVALDNIKVKKDKNGIQSAGSITTKELFVQWPNQKLQGDIALTNVSMRMKDENDISLEGALAAGHVLTTISNKDISLQHIVLENIQLHVLDQKNIALTTKLSVDDLDIVLGKNLHLAASAKTDQLSFNLDDGIVKVSTSLHASKAKILLDHHRTIEASPQLELNLRMPLDTPQEATYHGSITLSDGSVQGFSPIQSLNNVELDADFKTDEATINALSVNVLDTNVRANGSIKNFKNPILNMTADAEDLNLARINDIAPQLVGQYGLSVDGTSFVKVQFNGLLSKPLDAKILVAASVKDVNVTSSTLHQQLNHITGTIEATPDSLRWHDFSAMYHGQAYTLGGSLENFKRPQIMTTLDGKDLHLKADLLKDNDLITIHALSGKYLNAAFDGKGTITLMAGQGPLFDINSNVSLVLEDMLKYLPAQQRKSIEPLKPTGMISISTEIKGTGADWKNYTLSGTIISPVISLIGYNLTDMKISIDQGEGKLKNLTFDGKLYGGIVHGVGSLDLLTKGMPFDAALNIDSTDLRKLKMDSPLKMDEIDGKFYFTSVAHGTLIDFKNSLHATGSLAIRDGFLAEFNIFKGLLSVLNDAMRLGQVQITDVESNFTIQDQKINTDNLRLKGPTLVLLGKGWINFNQLCDLNITVDLSSGVVPAIAENVLSSLNIHIYDKISDPKFKKKISVPQVINTLLKNLLQ